MSSSTNKAIQGASFLAITSLLAKVLAAFYRIPYQNYVGDVGFYVYQQVYPIYGLAMILALGGFPLFVSKLVAESSNRQEEKILLHRAFVQITAISITCFLFFFLLQRPLAQLMGDNKLAPLIGITSFTFLIVPITSMIRGGFQGHLVMRPTGISQVIEQLVRVGIIWFAAYAFVSCGIDSYQTGEVALSGSIFGGGGAICFLLVSFRRQKRVPRFFAKSVPSTTASLSSRRLFRRLVLEGGGLSVYSGLLVLYQFVDSFTVKNALLAHGFSHTFAENQKGIYDRSQPIVQLGLVVALAFSSSFLPVLAEHFSKGAKVSFEKTKLLYMKVSLVLSSAATVGLICLFPMMNAILFQDRKLSTTIEIYLLAIFFMGISQAVQSVFQSEDKAVFPIVAALLSLFGKIMLTYPLTQRFGTIGASISTILATMVVAGLLFWRKKIGISLSFYGKLAFSLFLMSLPLILMREVTAQLQQRGALLLFYLLAVGVGAGLFFLVLRKLEVFDKEELKQFFNKSERKEHHEIR